MTIRSRDEKGRIIPFQATDDQRGQVQALATFGVTHELIAEYIGITRPTLVAHFQAELDKAKIAKEVKVRQFLFEGATGEAIDKHGASYSACVRAAFFWAKTQMGWREKQDLNHTSEDGSMSPRAVDASTLSDSALEELMRARRTESNE